MLTIVAMSFVLGWLAQNAVRNLQLDSDAHPVGAPYFENLDLAAKIQALDFSRHILPEALFLGMLSLDRRRAERSGDNLFLILIDAHRALETTSADNVLRRATKTADEVRRDTDIAGWYKDRAILGILFTVFRDSQVPDIPAMLYHKVLRSLENELTAEEIALVGVSIHTFASESDELSNSVFYPNVVQRLESDRTKAYEEKKKRLMEELKEKQRRLKETHEQK
jgi:hypothetical protein